MSNFTGIYGCIQYDSFLDLKEYIRCHPDEINKCLDDNEQITPLIFAINQGLFDIAIYLIEKGANINLTDKYNMSALMYAVQKNSFEVCKKLLDTDKELVNIEEKNGKYMAVWYAVLHMGSQPSDSIDFKIFDLLIENGADINKSISNGITPYELITRQKNAKEILAHIKTNFPRIPLPTSA